MVRGGPGQEQWLKQHQDHGISRNVSIRNRKFLRSFTWVADMIAEDVVPSSPVTQLHPDNEGGQAT